MQHIHQHNHHDALARLTASLCDVMAQFMADMAVTQRAEPSHTYIAANDNEAADGPESRWPDDPMTLKEVQFELRLKEKQIVALRRLWGFPAPVHRGGKLLFSRRQVERWVGLQPNAQNLAAVLRLRRRRLPKSA